MVGAPQPLAVVRIEVVASHHVSGGAKARDRPYCQVNEILMGADAIVLVSEGGRPKLAQEIWRRIDARREPQNQRPLHKIAYAPGPEREKKTPVRKAKKKQEALA